MLKNILLFLTAAIILISCHSDRNRVLYKYHTCEEIFDELEYARQFEKEIHENDKFMWRYLFVLPAIWETKQIMRNEYEVQKRKKMLYFEARKQKCYGENMPSVQEFDQNLHVYEQKRDTELQMKTGDWYKMYNEEQFYKQYEREMMQQH